MAFTIKRYALAFASVTLATVAVSPAAYADEPATDISVKSSSLAASTIAADKPITTVKLSPVNFNLDDQAGSVSQSGEIAPAANYLPADIRKGNFTASSLNPFNTVPTNTDNVAAYRQGTGLGVVNGGQAAFGEISSDVPGPTARVRPVNRSASFRLKI